MIRRVFTEHQRIIFNGNGYDEAWLEEAGKRGLSNPSTIALPRPRPSSLNSEKPIVVSAVELLCDYLAELDQK